MKIGIWAVVTNMLLLFLTNGFCQEKTTIIQLLDNNTLTPIEGATYRYLNQIGVSDVTGQIHIISGKADTLFISHIAYGEWFVANDDLQAAIESGVLFRDRDIMTAQPITIIALRPQSQKSERFGLEQQDKLAHDGGAVLQKNPAISSIKKSGSYGFDPVLRGFKYDQLNILIDGAQGAVAACPNRMDPPTSQMAPNMIEHIEVFKGPHSFRYGTSFGGTINFESTPMQIGFDKNIYGRISGSFESNGGIYRTEGTIGRSGNFYDISLFGSWSKGSDYISGNGIEIPGIFQRSNYGLRAGFNISESQKMIFSVARNKAKDTDFPALPMDLISDDTDLFNLQHKIILRGKPLYSWNTTLFSTKVDHYMDNLGKDLYPRMMNAGTDANTQSYGGRSEGTWQFDQSKLFTGLDVRIEEASGTRTREFLMGPNKGNTVMDNVWNDGRVSKYGVFAEYQYYYPSFKIITSARLEFNKAVARNADPDFLIKNPGDVNSDHINPNFSIGGLYEFSDNFSVGMWLGRAQRSGSLTERYINSFPVGVDPYDMLGNPQLSPEINNQIDLTMAYNTVSMSIDINLFASVLNNYISSKIDTSLRPIMPSSPGVRRYMNIDDAFMTGFEINWQQKLAAGLDHNLSVAYTYGRDNVRKEPLPEIAPLDFRYTIMGSYFANKVRPLIVYRYVMQQNRISSSFGETHTPAFSVLDLALTWQISKIFSLSGGVQNLFNVAYYEHLSRFVKGQDYPVYAPGRNIYLSAFFDLM